MESYIDELKNKTIYDALQETDTLNDTLQKKVDSFDTDLRKFSELPGYSDIAIPETPVINIPEIQRNLIDTHKNNHYLNQVLKGRDRFVNIVTELFNRKHKGWRRWLPIRKDEEYNKEVKELDEILKTNLETSFLSELVKPISGFAVFSLEGFAIPALSLILECKNYAGIELYLPLICGIGAGLFGSSFTILGRWAYWQLGPLQNQAKYLDKKMEDLMK